VRCGQNLLYRAGFSCIADKRIPWINVKVVRFGPKAGQWASALEPAYTAEKFLADESSGDAALFRFDVPLDWSDVFHQIVYADGTSSDIERVRVSGR
jgi:hypothetical protein